MGLRQGRESPQDSPQVEVLRGDVMLAPNEVAAIVRLHELGWGTKRIARELGCSLNTVRRYLESGGWVAYRATATPTISNCFSLIVAPREDAGTS